MSNIEEVKQSFHKGKGGKGSKVGKGSKGKGHQSLIIALAF